MSVNIWILIQIKKGQKMFLLLNPDMSFPSKFQIFENIPKYLWRAWKSKW
jgi:hypothetical protein